MFSIFIFEMKFWKDRLLDDSRWNRMMFFTVKLWEGIKDKSFISASLLQTDITHILHRSWWEGIGYKDWANIDVKAPCVCLKLDLLNILLTSHKNSCWNQFQSRVKSDQPGQRDGLGDRDPAWPRYKSHPTQIRSWTSILILLRLWWLLLGVN